MKIKTETEDGKDFQNDDFWRWLEAPFTKFHFYYEHPDYELDGFKKTCSHEIRKNVIRKTAIHRDGRAFSTFS